MLLENVTVNTTLEKRDRNVQVIVDSRLDLGGDIIIACNREVVLVNSEGKAVDMGGAYGETKYTFQKKISEIMNETITLPPQAGGLTLTAGQIALAFEMMTDKLAQEEKQST